MPKLESSDNSSSDAGGCGLLTFLFSYTLGSQPKNQDEQSARPDLQGQIIAV
jgi:hypothetical protein